MKGTSCGGSWRLWLLKPVWEAFVSRRLRDTLDALYDLVGEEVESSKLEANRDEKMDEMLRVGKDLGLLTLREYMDLRVELARVW